MTVRLAVSLALAMLASACAQLPSASPSLDSTASNTPAATPATSAAPAPAPVLAVPVQPAPAAAPQAPTQPPLVRQTQRRSRGAVTAGEARGDVTADARGAQPANEAPVRSVWDRIRRGYGMAPMDNALVREWENWYSSRPDYVARMIDRSSRYLYHVMEEVERRGMPSEIALLPMIESAYNPVAYSRSHASGIWQFIPSTGQHYGLRQNWWYDGRRDIIAATNAALDYLEKLYGMFNNWELALASYNWGEGAVGRAIARNEARGLPGDYQSLTMPAETRGYVPKLIAVKNIIADPARFGLVLADVPNEPYFATVPVKRHIDLKLAAKLAEMPLDEFKFLNPAHNKPVIKRGSAETIVLPRHKVKTFLANLEAHDKPLVSWQAHTVKAGEKPEKIAARYGMSLTELKEVNGITDRRRIATGVPLLVPVTSATAEPNLPDLPSTPVTLTKAVKEAKEAPATKTAKGGAARLEHVKVVRNGVKPAKVAQRPAAAQKVAKKRAPGVTEKQVVAKAKPQSGSKKVMVADNKKQ